MSNYIYDPQVFTFSTPASVWTMEHNFGRTVNAEFYNDAGARIFPEEQEVDLNTYSATFYYDGQLSPQTGKAIIS